MARWKLTNKHYLNSPGIKWAHEETTNTGKRFRKEFDVPVYLDPDDREFQNRDGDIIVAYEASAEKGDVVFTGKPTPEMIPMDKEAEEISAAMQPGWDHPIESLPAQGQSILPPPAVERRL